MSEEGNKYFFHNFTMKNYWNVNAFCFVFFCHLSLHVLVCIHETFNLLTLPRL